MAELRIGDPALLSTDIGPVIDGEAQAMLQRHAQRMRREGRVVIEMQAPPGTERGSFFAPAAYEIDALDRLEGKCSARSSMSCAGRPVASTK